MTSRFGRINTRVLTVILLVALPVLVIGAAVVIGIGQSRAMAAQTAQLEQIAAHAAAAVDAYVFRRILDGALLARAPDIRRAAAAGNASAFDEAAALELDRQWQQDPAGTAGRLPVLTAPASQFLADLVRHDSVYREVLATDRHGRLVAASNITSDYFQADEPWWSRAYDGGRGRVVVGDVQRDESAQVYALEIAVPIMAPDSDQLAGVMKIVADSREMLTGVAGLELGTTSEALLVRPDGSIVFRRRPHAPSDRFFASDLLRERLEARALRKEAPGPFSYTAQTEDGDRRVVAVAPSQLSHSYPDLPWLMAVSMEVSELAAPFNSLVWYLAIVVLVVAAAVLAFALWFSLRLAAPPIDPDYDLHLVEHARVQRLDADETAPQS